MPSVRTDGPTTSASGWRRLDPRSPLSLLERLNARLVLALAAVALVSLLVSGIAINQILPPYFIEQTEERLATSAASAAIDLRQEVARYGDQTFGRNTALIRELRDARIVPDIATRWARIANATVDIYNDLGQRVERAAPADVTALQAQGLRRDEEVGEQRVFVDVLLPDESVTRYEIVLSEPYSARAETLQQIESAIIGAGMLALAASLVVGVIAARRITRPIGRLRRVAGRVAQGQLDERAVPSGVLEVDELGQQFNVMADRLAGTLRMLEADRDRLREFVADVSHEFRTPIAALRMYTELQHDGDVDEATRREFLERSAEQIARLEWMSTNLLDLSRIDAGIFPLDMGEGDLRDPIQATVQALSEVAVARGVSLDSEVPAHPIAMRFDRERIVQLLTNLVGNALKFTPRGGGVSVSVEERDDEVTIRVADTGAGIPRDELPHIFDRFYRGTNTGDARATGSGLGLAIVRSIVEMHGGSVDVASVVGEGTEFLVRLPRTSAPEPVGNAAPEPKVNETSPPAQRARNPRPIP